MLVKNTLVALLVAAPALAIPVVGKASEKAVGTTKAAKVSKSDVAAANKQAAADRLEIAKLRKLERAAEARLTKDTTRAKSLKNTELAQERAAAKAAKASKNKLGLKIDTKNLKNKKGLKSPKSAKSLKSGLKSPKSAKSRKSAKLTPKQLKALRSAKHLKALKSGKKTPKSALKSPKTPKSAKSLKSLKTPGSAKSLKSLKSGKTPKTPLSAKQLKALRSARLRKHRAGLRSPKSAHSHKSHKSHKSRKGSLKTPTSATSSLNSPYTPGSAYSSPYSGLSTGFSQGGFSPSPYSAGFGSPYGAASPYAGGSPYAAGSPFSAGAHLKHQKITTNKDGSVSQDFEYDSAPASASSPRFARRADIPATPASASAVPPTSPSVAVHKTHRRKAGKLHKHTVAEKVQLNAMLAEAEHLVNGLEGQLDQTQTTFPHLQKAKATKMRRLRKLFGAKTPTTPTSPASKSA